ncbi:hypothetical protein CKAH01_07056 [Colletotrichum kahawae]|uniref:Uncharacterized protein n=1 Tax=Colletotrichum kahawae TaxID=34407 RepID=A0AAD9Y7G6_COLKA|nr:hypothetical protein CKAH01_07056 [Colletotrichum kahawae]
MSQYYLVIGVSREHAHYSSNVLDVREGQAKDLLANRPQSPANPRLVSSLPPINGDRQSYPSAETPHMRETFSALYAYE